jgi:hypothetical protein
VDAGRGLLPWAWLGRLAPPLALSRAPVRLVHLGGLLLAVALAVLATRAAGPEGGLAPPAPRAGGRRRAALLAGLLVLLVLERWPARPVPVEPVAVPEAYRRLAAAPGALAVLQWPEESYAHWMHYLFWQTVHRKPMVLGYVSRRPPGADRFLARLGAAPPEARRALLEAAGVGWLVIHPPEPWGFEREPALIPLAAPPP